MTRAASAPVVSVTWPSCFTSRSSARYSTSEREASAFTADAGRLTARTGKFEYDTVTEPLLPFTALSSVAFQAPAAFTTTLILPPPPSFCLRSAETLSRPGAAIRARAGVAPCQQTADARTASVARSAIRDVSLLLIKWFPFGLDRGLVRPGYAAALTGRGVPKRTKGERREFCADSCRRLGARRSV